MTLELQGVGKTVGQDVHIHPTDLKLEPGRFNILLGTTLSGKTSLMQLMAGLERPTDGRLFFNGKDATGQSVQSRNVSMVYQQFINYPNMSVFDNIASPLRVARLDKATIKQRVGEMAELLRITAQLDRRPSELSGGQQQRTAMARALVKDSDLVLLDEPLANLDFKLREELRDELPKLFSGRNCVVVYATTEPSEALLFGGHTAALHEGRVASFGPTASVYRKPGDLISAKVFSEPPMNTAKIVRRDGRMHLTDRVSWDMGGDLPDGDYLLGIRSHAVLPVDKGNGGVAIQGSVKVSELTGSESIIHFDAFGNDWISLSQGVHPFAAGQAATLYIDVSQAYYFAPDGRLAWSQQSKAGG